MNLRRYLATIFVVNCVAWWLLGYLLVDEFTASGWKGRLVLFGPLAAGLITRLVYRFANDVAVPNRNGFLSYRTANLVLAGVWVCILLAGASVFWGHGA